MRILKRSIWPHLSDRLVEPFAYSYSKQLSQRSGKTRASLLLLSDGLAWTSEEQFAPMLQYRSALSRRFGICVRHQHVRDASRLDSAFFDEYDIVGLKLSAFTDPANARQTVELVRARMRPSSKLLYFDGDDDICIAWPELLPWFDFYIKKHCFRDRRDYLKGTTGKTNLTNYVARKYGTTFDNNIFTSVGPVASDQLGKILVGWNVAFDRRIQEFARSVEHSDKINAKTIDLICRATVQSDWTQPLRSNLQDRLDFLGEEFDVRTARTRVSQEEYNLEMLASKICVSPFGYGEICWRDFEAIASDCVLVKPEMSHIETFPDIFVPGLTYEPVDWEYSDLESVVRRLLADPDHCDELRQNAGAVLRNALAPNAIQERIAAVLAPALS
jgi:hypothetical protein